MGTTWEIRDKDGVLHYFGNIWQMFKFLISVKFKIYYIRRNFYE